VTRLDGAVRLHGVMIPLGAVLVGFTILWRLWLGPLGGVGELSPHEARVGLMAVEVWSGGWPDLFVWGSPTTGALEPLGVAAVFSLGDVGPRALRSFPYVVHLLWLALTLWMAGAWLGRRGLGLALVTAGLAFPGTTEELVRAQGGLSLGLWAGLLALGASCTVSVSQPRKMSFRAGALCGLAVWGHQALLPLSLGAVVACGLGVLPALWHPTCMLQAIHHVARFLVGLSVGAAVVFAGRGTEPLAGLQPAEVASHVSGGAEPATAWIAAALGSTLAVYVVWLVMALGAVAVLARLGQRGLDDKGARLGAGAWTAVAAAYVLAVVSHGRLEADVVTLVPLVACLPLVAASVSALRLGGAVVALGTLLAVASVDATALPPRHGPGHDAPLGPVVSALLSRPGGAPACHASPGLAHRLALELPSHRCLGLGQPDVRPAWRQELAAGPRVYVFSADEMADVVAFDQELKAARTRTRRDSAGVFLLRYTEGVAWPPKVGPIMFEHGRRHLGAAIDGKVGTVVSAAQGQRVTLDLVWPTALQHVSYWQDVQALATAPCAVRAGVVAEGGRQEAGPVVDLRASCGLARRWALWPQATLEVRLPVPGKPAVAVWLETAGEDDAAVLSAAEIRVAPRKTGARE
jgi:hypothetical protein